MRIISNFEDPVSRAALRAAISTNQNITTVVTPNGKMNFYNVSNEERELYNAMEIQTFQPMHAYRVAAEFSDGLIILYKQRTTINSTIVAMQGFFRDSKKPILVITQEGPGLPSEPILDFLRENRIQNPYFLGTMDQNYMESFFQDLFKQYNEQKCTNGCSKLCSDCSSI